MKFVNNACDVRYWPKQTWASATRMSAFGGKADIKTNLILDFLIQCEPRREDPHLARLSLGLIFGWSSYGRPRACTRTV
jgi:hypothetical protein